MPPRILVASTTPGTDGERAGVELEWMSPLVIVPRFAEMKTALLRLNEARTIALTSAHAVDALVGGLRALGHDVRALFGLRLAAVGEATAARLGHYGLSADLIAHGGGAALAAEIIASGLPDPIWHPSAADGRPELADALVAAGRRVEVVAAYESAPDAAAIKRALLRHAEHPYAGVAFTSPRGARALLDVFGVARLVTARIGAIGETTRAELAAAGFAHIVVAATPSLDGLVSALVSALASASIDALADELVPPDRVVDDRER